MSQGRFALADTIVAQQNLPLRWTTLLDKTAIIVLGMHRSGTSALARTISLLGARLPDDLVGPNEGNPHGHWEPKGIVELNDRMLADAGSDVYGILDVPAAWFSSPRAQEFTEEAAKIIGDSFQNNPLIVMKDPRTAVMLPVWTAAFAQCGYRMLHVLPLRHPDSVADSLARRHLKTIEYDAWPAPRGQLVWLRYTLAAIRGSRDQQRAFVTYADLLNDWRLAADRIAADLGIAWPNNPDSISQGVSEFLHSNELASEPARQPMHDAAALATLSLRELASELYAVLATRGDDRASIDAIADEFDRRMTGSSDLIRALEGLFPVLWTYYERSKTQSIDLPAIYSSTDLPTTVKSLWSTLTKTNNQMVVLQQERGSDLQRIKGLEVELEADIRPLIRERDALNAEKKTLQSEKEALHSEKAALLALANELAAQRDDLKVHYDAAIAQIQAMYKSASWRISAPFRLVSRWLKR